LPLGNDIDIALNPFVERRWINRIKNLHPDIVHAHNVVVARFMLRINIPTVYDDHEYWSKLYVPYYHRKFPKDILSKPITFLMPLWERRLLKRFPTLTVTDTIAKDYRRMCKWVGVTKNVPYRWEVENLPMNRTRKGIVYVGNDFSRPSWHPLRNMAGLRDVLDFEIITGLPHQEMLTQLTRFEVGITPWRMLPVHKYVGPNKNYEYLHAGLQVVTNRLIKENVFPTDPYVSSYTDYSDIRQIILNLESYECEEIMKYAREKYVWDRQEEAIQEAYEIALHP
jgi:hypothetical protein